MCVEEDTRVMCLSLSGRRGSRRGAEPATMVDTRPPPTPARGGHLSEVIPGPRLRWCGSQLLQRNDSGPGSMSVAQIWTLVSGPASLFLPHFLSHPGGHSHYPPPPTPVHFMQPICFSLTKLRVKGALISNLRTEGLGGTLTPCSAEGG